MLYFYLRVGYGFWEYFYRLYPPFLAQIIDGMKYMIKNKVIHRDMKLGNLFLDEKMEVKIGDFGLAAKVVFDGEKKRTI